MAIVCAPRILTFALIPESLPYQTPKKTHGMALGTGGWRCVRARYSVRTEYYLMRLLFVDITFSFQKTSQLSPFDSLSLVFFFSIIIRWRFVCRAGKTIRWRRRQMTCMRTIYWRATKYMGRAKQEKKKVLFSFDFECQVMVFIRCLVSS